MSNSFDNEIYLNPDLNGPILYVNGTEYKGINILSKLKSLNDNNQLMKGQLMYYTMASTYFQNESIPIVKYMLKDENAIVPTRSIENVGYDLTIIKEYQRISKNTCIYDTGVSFQLPLGWFGTVYLRSSVSKLGYIMSNCVGIIDPGYTGTIKVALTKIDHDCPDLELPHRIAQMVLSPYVNTELQRTQEVISTNRGAGGFGSTN